MKTLFWPGIVVVLIVFCLVFTIFGFVFNGSSPSSRRGLRVYIVNPEKASGNSP